MFIVSLNYKVDLEEVDGHLDDHVAYLKKEYARGNFVASGRKVPRTGGVILSCIKDIRELQAILERDPFHVAGIAEYEIIDFTPSMVAEGFEVLQK